MTIIQMTITLSAEELAIIESWYISASGESATERSMKSFALLDKLGIHATKRDLYYPDPNDTVEEYRDEVIAEIEAIKAYRLRHPHYEEVSDGILNSLPNY